jgi:RNA exonuclease 4
VSDIIEHRTLVGHALHNDLQVNIFTNEDIKQSFSFQVLFLSHPKRRIRDTQRYKGFRSLLNGGLPSLKSLAHKVLGLKIQTGAHDSVSVQRNNFSHSNN